MDAHCPSATNERVRYATLICSGFSKSSVDLESRLRFRRTAGGEALPRTELCRTIIAVNRVAIVEKAPEKVFDQMCAVLKKVVPYDRAGLTVYDPGQNALKIAALYGRYENRFFRVGDSLARNDSQNGWTFEHQSRTLRRDLAKEHQFSPEKHTLEEGFRSLCSVP